MVTVLAAVMVARDRMVARTAGFRRDKTLATAATDDTPLVPKNNKSLEPNEELRAMLFAQDAYYTSRHVAGDSPISLEQAGQFRANAECSGEGVARQQRDHATAVRTVDAGGPEPYRADRADQRRRLRPFRAGSERWRSSPVAVD